MQKLIVASFLVALSTSSGADPTLSFDTIGGDAWTFEAQISGQIPGEISGAIPAVSPSKANAASCEAIFVRSPVAQVRALRIDEKFSARVPLRAGDNEVQALCRQQGREFALSEIQRWYVPIADVPKAWIRVDIDKDAIHLNAGRSEAAPSAAADIVRYEWRARENNPAVLRSKDGNALHVRDALEGEDLELSVPSVDGEYYVRLRVTDALGHVNESTAVFRIAAGTPRRVDLKSEHPKWVDHAVVYGATPYVFNPQDFTGVRERLDEIASLGATVLWLSPVNAAPDDDFGYAVLDHFALRSRFGTPEQFRHLIEVAHQLGLRVMLDFVPNHVSSQHRYFKQALALEQRSPYYDWFERDEHGEPTQYFDWSHLKNLNFDNREVQNYIIDAFSRLVREYGVDGFRVDASWAVAERAPEFWPRLRAEIKRIDPDIFLLAEASAREPYHVANGFDAAYDWTWNLGEWAWREVFEDGSVDLARLRAALTNEGAGFPDDSLVLRFLNNNDTGERFITRHGVEVAQLSATMLFTLPGIPLIYNGDEMGAAFEPYDEGPPLLWNDEHPLVAHYRSLAALRANTDALRSRELQLVKTTQKDAILAYLRPSHDGDDVLVVLNFSKHRHAIEAADAQGAAVLSQFARSIDLLSGTRYRPTGSSVSLHIEPMNALVLRAVE